MPPSVLSDQPLAACGHGELEIWPVRIEIFSCLENPREGKPGWLPSMGSHRVGHDLSDTAAAAAVTIIDILWKKQNTGDSECRNCSLEMLVRMPTRRWGNVCWE